MYHNHRQLLLSQSMEENCFKNYRELVRQQIKKAQTRQKEQYDKHSHEPVIKVDDLVMLKVDANLS